MIGPSQGEVLEPLDLLPSDSRLDRLAAPAPDPEMPSRRLVSFKDPDGAYLAAAALRRYLDATVVSDVILVPTAQGPALEIPADAASLQVLKAIVLRFGGRIGPVE